MQNKNKTFVLAVVAVTFGAFALGWMVTTLNSRNEAPELAVLEAPVPSDGMNSFEIEPAAGEDDAAADASMEPEAVADEEGTPVPAEAPETTSPVLAPAAEPAAEPAPAADTASAEDFEKNPLTSTRAIGAEDAPVVMEEFFSLTCSHCAAFHRDVMPTLKTEYVDTGKLRIVFHDYPLNPPAFQAAILARCLDPEQYYNFVSVLFETQEEWSHESSPAKLIQTAKLAGLSDESLDMCMENKDVTKFILTNMQDFGAKHDIKSTPTFVFNKGAGMIRGNRAAEEFKAEIDRLIAAAGDKAE